MIFYSKAVWWILALTSSESICSSFHFPSPRDQRWGFMWVTSQPVLYFSHGSQLLSFSHFYSVLLVSCAVMIQDFSLLLQGVTATLQYLQPIPQTATNVNRSYEVQFKVQYIRCLSHHLCKSVVKATTWEIRDARELLPDSLKHFSKYWMLTVLCVLFWPPPALCVQCSILIYIHW